MHYVLGCERRYDSERVWAGVRRNKKKPIGFRFFTSENSVTAWFFFSEKRNQNGITMDLVVRTAVRQCTPTSHGVLTLCRQHWL